MSKTKVLYKPKGRAGEYSAGFALNLYSGCASKCRYCYVPSVLHKSREEWENTPTEPRKDILKLLENDLEKAGKLDEPIFLCFTCDPYPEVERELKLTRRAIEIIKGSGNNVRILTKNGELAQRDFDLLDHNDEFGVTLTFDSREDSSLWEPFTDAPGMRLESLRVAKWSGIKTWASFEPVIDPEQTLKLIDFASMYIDLAKIGKSNHLGRWDWPSEEWRKRMESIDWAEFGKRAVELCEQIDLKYYIKQDLRDAMDVTDGE